MNICKDCKLPNGEHDFDCNRCDECDGTGLDPTTLNDDIGPETCGACDGSGTRNCDAYEEYQNKKDYDYQASKND